MRNDYFCTRLLLNTVFSQLLMVSGFKGPWSLYAIVIASYK